MNRTLTLATVVLVGLAVALALWLILLLPGDNERPLSPLEPQQDSAPSGTTTGTAARDYPSRLLDAASDDIPGQLPASLPASLEGTDLPSGWDQTDASGSLIPTPELRQLFEHYLAALGEESLAQLVERIRRSLDRLQEPARSEAMAVLGNYLDYKLELGELEAAPGITAGLDPEAMAQQMSAIRSLRRQWLGGETADAFFSVEEAVDDFQLARMRIHADESLGDEARQQQLQQAEQALPEPIREARQQTRRFSDYQQAQQQFSNDPGALQAWREANFGPEAAERLARVEADQREWDQRWQAYQQKRAELDRLGLAGPEREAAIKHLREQFFEGPERYRAEALDSIQ